MSVEGLALDVFIPLINTKEQEKITEKLKKSWVNYSDTEAVLVVGHEPLLGWLTEDLRFGPQIGVKSKNLLGIGKSSCNILPFLQPVRKIFKNTKKGEFFLKRRYSSPPVKVALSQSELMCLAFDESVRANLQ